MSTKVLVIEDELELNELLGEYLTLEDYQYLQALTGQAGIHLASTQHPDAIILDLMLPDIDGFEVARNLSSHRATYNIPIIIHTCMREDAAREKAYSAGALYFFHKPCPPDDVLNALRQAFEWKESLATRAPAGSILLGAADTAGALETSQAIHQMVGDIFARTSLSDADVAQVREGIETLGTWARQWNSQHTPSILTVDYRVQTDKVGASAPMIEWKLTESTPGLLSDAFFKQAPVATSAGIGGGLMGWGAGSLATTPAAALSPAARWLQVLAKVGAERFEKDGSARMVRFVRNIGGVRPAVTANGAVPVVEIDGVRYPTRLRDEALAAKRK